MANPVTITLALAGGVLPALVWLFFWLREDRAHPEPQSLIASIFIVGAVAVLPTYLIQELMRLVWNLDTTTHLIPTILTWAAIEESIKYLVVALIALSTPYFDEPIDAMIYMLTAALGFAAAENSLFMFNVLHDGGNQAGFWLNGNFRFIGATMVHVVSSAIVGSFIALAYKKRRQHLVLATVSGITIATILHTLFNYFIIKSASVDVLKIFTLFWALGIVVIYLFERVKGVPLLATHQE